MKHNKIIILLGICLTGSLSFALGKKPNPVESGFAVIELFTSEGCSSCPPADELVAKVQREYQNRPVYILAFHVDYWNRLGWKDVYSNADYSKRQEAYARSLHIPSVYTPQIVVNGSQEFVGSQEGVLRNAIKAGLQKPGSVQIALSIKNSGTQLTMHYHTVGTSKYSEVILALVQKSAQTNVKAGENQGHTLSHVQIVRQMQRLAIGVNKDGTSQLMLPKGISAQNSEVIALVQDTASGQIIAATKQALPIAS